MKKKNKSEETNNFEKKNFWSVYKIKKVKEKVRNINIKSIPIIFSLVLLEESSVSLSDQRKLKSNFLSICVFLALLKSLNNYLNGSLYNCWNVMLYQSLSICKFGQPIFNTHKFLVLDVFYVDLDDSKVPLLDHIWIAYICTLLGILNDFHHRMCSVYHDI